MHKYRARSAVSLKNPSKRDKNHHLDREGYDPDWVVGRLGVMEFLASGHGDAALANDMTHLRGIQHIDAGPRQVGSFVLCDQLVTA